MDSAPALDPLDLAVAAGELAAGATPAWLQQKGFDCQGLLFASRVRQQPAQGRRGPTWTEEEDDFIRANLGYMGVAEMAEALGRPSALSVDSRIARLGLPARPAWSLSTRDVADILNNDYDRRRVLSWMKEDTMPSVALGLTGQQHTIPWPWFKRWAANPLNWVYFDPEKVTDADLRRLILRRRERWGDCWWTTEQVAAYHGVRANDVVRLIKDGKLKSARQPLGYKTPWYVLRSEATAPGFAFRHTSAHTEKTAAGDAFAVLARAVGLSGRQVEALNGWIDGGVLQRLNTLWQSDKMAGVIEENRLPVRYREEDRTIWADWREHAGRFPFLAHSVARFKAGRPLTREERTCVSGVLAVWFRWHGYRRLSRMVRRINKAGDDSLRSWYARARRYGVDPFTD